MTMITPNNKTEWINSTRQYLYLAYINKCLFGLTGNNSFMVDSIQDDCSEALAQYICKERKWDMCDPICEIDSNGDAFYTEDCGLYLIEAMNEYIDSFYDTHTYDSISDKDILQLFNYLTTITPEGRYIINDAEQVNENY